MAKLGERGPASLDKHLNLTLDAPPLFFLAIEKMILELEGAREEWIVAHQLTSSRFRFCNST